MSDIDLNLKFVYFLTAYSINGTVDTGKKHNSHFMMSLFGRLFGKVIVSMGQVFNQNTELKTNISVLHIFV